MKADYSPRPLSVSREYPGYQFYARACIKGRSADDCLRAIALTVQNWLCERIAKADGRVPDEIACPPRGAYMDVRTRDLRSCALPFAQIVSLPDEGVWALMVREPDPELAARSYVTHAAVRSREDGEAEFGVHVDVVDRDPSLPEAAMAYRPQFIRLLFETEGMELRQAGRLAFREYTLVADRRGIERLKDTADDRRGSLPLVVFTHAKARPSPGAELPPEGFSALPPRAVPERFAGREADGAGYFLPYDAAEFARHIYGFARAYVASPEAFRALRAKFNRARLNEGDVLVVDPRAFGARVRVVGYREGQPEEARRSEMAELTDALKGWSKNRPFAFGDVLFVEDALQVLRAKELDAIRADARLRGSEEAGRILQQLEQERALSAGQAAQIAQLRAQMLDEYRRGRESERQRSEKLERQLKSVKAENAALRSRCEATERALSQFGAMKEAAARVQQIPHMPKTTADVAAFFAQVFADRIAFTERGIRTAARCSVNPDVLWECLYCAATALVDLHRAGVQDVEARFRRMTGWEMAVSEGSQTHRDSEYMALRRDVFEGREISVEPHIKFPGSLKKTGAKYQRLYYAYDPYSGKIVVGCVGDHLENFLSLGFH